MLLAFVFVRFCLLIFLLCGCFACLFDCFGCSLYLVCLLFCYWFDTGLTFWILVGLFTCLVFFFCFVNDVAMIGLLLRCLLVSVGMLACCCVGCFALVCFDGCLCFYCLFCRVALRVIVGYGCFRVYCCVNWFLLFDSLKWVWFLFAVFDWFALLTNSVDCVLLLLLEFILIYFICIDYLV